MLCGNAKHHDDKNSEVNKMCNPVSNLAIEECGLGLDNCDANAQCIDTDESFFCVCNPGYEGNGVSCCKCVMYMHSSELKVHVSHIVYISCIACADGDLRLVGGLALSEGRVEICIENAYGTICDDRWDEEDATVVCTQLQFSPNGMFS